MRSTIADSRQRSTRTAAATAVVETHPVLVVVVVAALARLLVALGSFLTTDGVLLPDELTYLGLASAIADGPGAEAWQPGYGPTLYETTWAFSAPLVLLFEVFPSSRLVGQLLAAAGG